MKTKQKGYFLPIIAVVLLVLVGAGAYYFGYDHGFEKSVKDTQLVVASSPIANETANWKIFSNKDYSFKYPTDYKLEVIQEEIHLTKTLILPTGCYDCSPSVKIIMNIDKNINNSTLEEVANSYNKSKYGQELLQNLKKPKIMNGMNVIEVPVGAYDTDYYLLMNDSILNISTSVGYGSAYDTLGQIFSTFKFTQ